LYDKTIRGELINPKDLLADDDFIKLKRRIVSLKQRSTFPPICTHNMINENDEILQVC
jgi:hypothetical protein